MNTTTTLPQQKTKLLINRNFGLLWIGQTISIIGDFFFSTTLVLWIIAVLAKGQPWAPLAVSGVALAQTVPPLVVGPMAGVFVDRWDKRSTMLRMDAFRALLIASILLTTGLVPLPFLAGVYLPLAWQLGSMYSMLVLESCCAQFFNPARMAIIRDIVPDPLRTRAIGLNSVAFNLALILAPGLAAPLFFQFGAAWAILIDALSFGISFLLIFALRVPPSARSTKAGQKGNYFRELLEGLQFFRGNRVLIVLLVTGIILNIGVGAFNALYLIFVLQTLHTPGNLAGLFTTAYGAAVILGLLILTILAHRVGEGRIFWPAIAAWGIFMLIFARITSFVPGLVLFFLLGFANAGTNIVVGPLKLRFTKREFVGRVEAIFIPVILASQFISVSIAGFLASTVLSGLHARLFGMAFGSIDTIFTGAGILVLGASVYAVLAFRGVNLAADEA